MMAQTRQIDYGARQYDPAIARWASTDPVIKEYYSLYSYVECIPILKVDINGLTSFIVNGKRESIDDGNYDLTLEVSLKQFKRLNRKFNRQNKTSYYAYLDLLSRSLGFYSYNTLQEDSSIGLLFTYHRPTKKSYGEWAVSNSDRVQNKTDLSNFLSSIKEMIKIMENKDITYAPISHSFHQKYYGNQYESVIRLKKSKLLKSAKKELLILGLYYDLKNIQRGFILDGNKWGYYSKQQIGEFLSGYVGATLGGTIGTAVSGPVAVVIGFVGATVGSYIMQDMVRQLMELILSI